MFDRTVGDKAAKVPADDTVPCRTFPLVELLQSVYGLGEDRHCRRDRTVRLMWWAISCQTISAGHGRSTRVFVPAYLLDAELLHRLLC